jgi:hypothetical protein
MTWERGWRISRTGMRARNTAMRAGGAGGAATRYDCGQRPGAVVVAGAGWTTTTVRGGLTNVGTTAA